MLRLTLDGPNRMGAMGLMIQILDPDWMRGKFSRCSIVPVAMYVRDTTWMDYESDRPLSCRSAHPMKWPALNLMMQRYPLNDTCRPHEVICDTDSSLTAMSGT
jgi:hypothetical protein